MTFTFTVSAADWARIAPELILAGMALILLLADLLLSRPDKSSNASGSLVVSPKLGLPAKTSGISGNYLVLPALSLLGLAGAFVATILLFVAGDHQNAFNSMIGSDFGSLYAYIIILSASILGILLSPAYLNRLNLGHQGEYYALMLLATIGMMLMAAAVSFLMVFLGLEMLSLALYILCGFVTRRQSSQESGMKYFLLSSFASAFLLYGIALIYGATGSTAFPAITKFVASHTHSTNLLFIGMGLLTVGFAFKVSGVPFQAWTPDVYEGAPAPVTAFMSVGTKAAAMLAFVRVFDVVLNPVANDWLPAVWVITILTIVGGNVMALVQSNVKRLLAYSSIAHAGYLMIGIVAGSVLGLASILFYLFCYTFLNLGAFGVVSILERVDNTGTNLSDIRGLWYRKPLLAGLLAFFLLALAGFPPMAGFAAKYYIFYAALQTGYPELLIIGVLASVLGMYYYLRVIASMFMEQEATIEAAPALGQAQGAVPTGIAAPATVVGSPAPVSATSRTGVTAVVAAEPAKPAANATKGSSPAVFEKSAEQGLFVGWTTWLALGVAALGALLMGTVLPFWLVNLAQQAGQMMMR